MFHLVIYGALQKLTHLPMCNDLDFTISDPISRTIVNGTQENLGNGNDNENTILQGQKFLH